MSRHRATTQRRGAHVRAATRPLRPATRPGQAATRPAAGLRHGSRAHGLGAPVRAAGQGVHLCTQPVFGLNALFQSLFWITVHKNFSKKK